MLHRLLILWFVLVGVVYSQTPKYEGKISFVASSRFGKVKGEFSKVGVVVTTNKIGSQVTVDVATINTGNSLRDNHLRNEDFFDVAKYPQARLVVNSFTKIEENFLRGSGILSIKNKQKEVDFPIKIEKTSSGQKYSGEFEINRMDFGIDYNSVINPISEKVLVQYSILEITE